MIFNSISVIVNVGVALTAVLAVVAVLAALWIIFPTPGLLTVAAAQLCAAVTFSLSRSYVALMRHQHGHSTFCHSEPKTNYMYL